MFHIISFDIVNLLAYCVVFDANAMIPVNDFTGYIVDKFCWDKPNHIAIDGSDLANDPKRHTLHCLWEVPQCRNSGYFLLELDSPTKKYVKKYTLDAASNTKAVALLEAMFRHRMQFATIAMDRKNKN